MAESCLNAMKKLIHTLQIYHLRVHHILFLYLSSAVTDHTRYTLEDSELAIIKELPLKERANMLRIRKASAQTQYVG